jgi:hypothetical protein
VTGVMSRVIELPSYKGSFTKAFEVPELIPRLMIVKFGSTGTTLLILSVGTSS